MFSILCAGVICIMTLFCLRTLGNLMCHDCVQSVERIFRSASVIPVRSIDFSQFPKLLSATDYFLLIMTLQTVKIRSSFSLPILLLFY